MDKVFDCGLEIGKFEPLLYYYIRLWTNTLGKNIKTSIPAAIYYIVPLLFFYKDVFCIK